ncbi:MAG: carboxypeptidase-like regulatory domain-containing protein [Planctomycetota bacterium]|nr:carboxypeptidase-like regulatory domain-containing protein [Planctomycetota bacterium]MDG1984622.1 carboxypeptidase-like regulatory domain-containing protein [Planctomycetota bacterium]
MKFLLALIALALVASGIFVVFFAPVPAATSGDENPAVFVEKNEAADDVETMASGDLADVGAAGAREIGDIGTVPTSVGADELASVALGTGILRGAVVGPDGSPVGGAQVTLTRFGSESFFLSDPDPSKDANTLTGSDGTFEFDGVPVFSDYALIASMQGFTRTEVPSIVVQDGKVTDVPPITLGTGVVVRGRVTDSGGNFVAGAKLILSQSVFNVRTSDADARNGGAEATSDENGLFTFNNVAAGANYAMRISADGYGSITELGIPILEGEDTEKDFVLEVASLIAGMVLASDTGEAIPGVTIEAYSVNNVKARSATSTKTTETGEFELSDINPGPYQLVARHPRYKAEARTRIDSGEMDVSITLEPLPMVSGQVVDLSTGAPINNFEVQLRQSIANSDNLSSAVNGTRARFENTGGQFEILVPKGGEYMVEAIANGFAETNSESFSVQPGVDFSGVVVRMTRGGSIVGLVLGEGGQPLQGAVIETRDKEWSDDLFWQSLGSAAPGNATEASAKSGADGSFKLDALTPANYQLVVRHRDYAVKYVKDLIVGEGQEFKASTVQLEKGAVVSGMVLGPNGSPMAGAVVKMYPTSAGGSQHSASTNPQGEFSVKNVRAGSYKIHATRARRGGDSPFQENSDLKRTQRTITVQNGQSLSGLDFKLSDR